MDKCVLHFYPGISNLAKKLSILWRARPGEYRRGPLVGKNGSKCEERSCQMCDQLELGGHELRQERQVAGETQRWRTLMPCITNAVGKILEEGET